MEELYPYYSAHLINDDSDSLTFRVNDNEITIKSNKELILKIINKSNGTFSYNSIAKEIAEDNKIDIEYIKSIIEDLTSLKILVDSRKQMLYAHSLTFNPSIYYQHLSNKKVIEIQNNHPNYMLKPMAIIKPKDITKSYFLDLLEKRHSCRSFDNKPIPEDKLFSICKSSYDSRLKPVASAGNLTPLSVFVIILQETENISRGVYQYDNDSGNLNLIRTDITNQELIYAFNDESIIFGAPCIFVITADLNRHMRKYANRGYRFTLLEVGHVLQNITIEAIEQGIDSVEYGGFKDMAVANLIGLSGNLLPIACEAFGYALNNDNKNNIEKAKIDFDDFEDELINKLKIVDNVVTINNKELDDSCINVVVSHYNKAEQRALRDKDRYGTGISNTFFNAATKSLMESYERYVCGKFYYDICCNADEIKDKIVNNQDFFPYSDEQLKRLNLSNFNKIDKMFFIRGYDYKNNTVFIPADYCFFPLVEESVGRKVLHHANSSGCAAHYDLKEAKKSAVAELIERDALMRIWLQKKSPSKIQYSSLPLNIQKRIKKYEEKGFSISVLLISNCYAFSVLICATKEKSAPYFVCGASTSFDSINEAIEKAFNEMEYSIIVYSNNIENDGEIIISPENVCTPVEHGNLYAYSNQLSRIKFLFNGDYVDINNIKIENQGQLEDLKLIFMEYKPILKQVHVVRAFSSELVPINFGYGSDFYCHKKIKEEIESYDGFPHFFA